MRKNYRPYRQTLSNYDQYDNADLAKSNKFVQPMCDPEYVSFKCLSPKVKLNNMMGGGKGYRGEKDERERKFSPNERSFLRHTTYVTKGQSLLGEPMPELSMKTKRKQTVYESRSNNYNPLLSPRLKEHSKTYERVPYQQVAFKVQNTTNSISQLKRYRQSYPKAAYSSKTQTNQTVPPYESRRNQQKFDQVFKKKDSFKPQFYTPKPNSTPQYSQNIKRIFSPEIQAFMHKSPTCKRYDSYNLCIKDFILDLRLGGGKYGTVHRATHIKTKSVYAIKKIKKSILQENMMIEQFRLQVKIQSYLQHENIVSIYGVFCDREYLYLLLEYMSSGTLYSLLKKKKKLRQDQAASKIRQIASAITHMHENGIVHRDIKPENIVMSGNVCKLCDFGWATICQDRRKTYCGTFDYAAPEILQGMQYDMSVDLWCLGVLTYELVVGKAPFYHISRKQTMHNILHVEEKQISYPPFVNEKTKSFIDCLLRKKPEERLCYSELLEHPFLAQSQSVE